MSISSVLNLKIIRGPILLSYILLTNPKELMYRPLKKYIYINIVDHATEYCESSVTFNNYILL